MAVSVFRVSTRVPILAGMLGSGLLFLGLYALAYGYNTGLLFQPTVDEYIEIGIKAYCLLAGSYLVRVALRRTEPDQPSSTASNN